MRNLAVACAAFILSVSILAGAADAQSDLPLGADFNFVQHHHPGDTYYYDGHYGHGFDYYGPYYPPYYPPYHRPWVIAPLVVPSETIYGPGAMRRFMGLDAWNPPAAVAPANPPIGGAAQPAPAAPPDDPPAAPQPNLRGTNEQAQALARTFIGYGDVHFRAQRYNDAYSRYRKAVAAAPQLADARFRYAFVLVALRRYDDAADELKQGLALDPNWPRSGFRLRDVYGDNPVAKDAHLEGMAEAAEADRFDGDVLMLIGVYLYFDDQRERAAPILQHAAELNPGDAEILRAFGAL